MTFIIKYDLNTLMYGKILHPTSKNINNNKKIQYMVSHCTIDYRKQWTLVLLWQSDDFRYTINNDLAGASVFIYQIHEEIENLNS